MTPLTFAALLIATSGLVLVIAIAKLIKEKKKQRAAVESSKADFDKALAGNDKKRALEAGRVYYRALRGGKLTTYDEQALANDIVSMG